MIKRTLYFGSEAYLSTRNEQLVVRFSDKEDQCIPIEDIGMLVADHYRLTFTQHLMSKLLANNVAFITCDSRHMPTGLLLSLDGNTVQAERFAAQIQASVPLKKRLWQQTVKAKIANQAHVLQRCGIAAENMRYWSKQVGSGDPHNHEARAAMYYWKHVFSDALPRFTRERFGQAPNPLLNYGYAVLRAIIARSLVGSGLLPTLGIYHRNKYNAYCLADDIMEPYRPFVDGLVLALHQQNPEADEVDKEAKRHLLTLPTVDVVINGQNSPLMIAAGHTTASLHECFAGRQQHIKYPSFPMV